MTGNIRHLVRLMRFEARARVSWFHVLFRLPNTSNIGWNTRIVGGRISVGANTVIEDFAYLQSGWVFSSQEYIKIGNDCSIRPYAQIYSWGGFVEIGDACSINTHTTLYGTGGIHIGNFVRIAAQTVIVASSHRFESLEVPIKDQGFTAQGIVVDDDVWVGAGCCILDNVTIGRGAIVAAGAVVNRNVEAYSIVGGVPARPIGTRLEKLRDLDVTDVTKESMQC